MDKDQESQDSPEEESPEPQQQSPKGAVSPASSKDTGESKEEKTRRHLERALKATGKAPVTNGGGKADAEDDDEPEDEEADEPEAKAEDDEAKEAPKPDRFDKIKNGKHLRQMVGKLKTEYAAKDADLDKREKAHATQQAKDDRINQAATEKYGPIAQCIVDYDGGKGNKVAAKKGCEKMFGVPFSQIARDFWDATKDGMATHELRQDLAEIKKELETRKTGEVEKTKEETAAVETKQLRSTFDKRVKAHALSDLDDSELNDEAFKLYKDSWDDDLDEYSLTPKQAADKVLAKEKKRAERLTGKRSEPVARETPRAREKPTKEMTKEEKKKYHLDRALRQTQMSARERRRSA